MLIDVAATLQAAALTLSNPGIELAVVSEEGGGGAQQIRSHSLMSRNIISCSSGDDLQAAWQVMMENRIQNMPVLGNDAKPLGVLDIRDALRVLFEQEQLQEHMLANYIAGIGY